MIKFTCKTIKKSYGISNLFNKLRNKIEYIFFFKKLLDRPQRIQAFWYFQKIEENG